MDQRATRAAIEGGRTALGIELGSTRIKAVLLGEDHAPIAAGSHDWENRLEDGVWTYSMDSLWSGLQDSYRKLREEVASRFDTRLPTVGAIGLSGMMHGYLPLRHDGALLAAFRTWRNTITAQASTELTELFGFNVPQRWSVAHVFQAILNGERHVGEIDYLTTLAGYVHWRLTGERVIGICEASGMFPVDAARKRYDARMVRLLDRRLAEAGIAWRIEDVLPRVLVAGEEAGVLSEEGARLLDPSGELGHGLPLCPPEGDAATGMVATNAVAARKGNVSAGTSVFAMIVLEHPLRKVHPEIDIVATPTGAPVAMVHCNNCTSDLNLWVRLFHEVANALGLDVTEHAMFELLFRQALVADADGGGLLAYNYVSGEHITHVERGRPLLVRAPGSRFTLANVMRTHLFSALATLRIGLDVLLEEESVGLDELTGHGGLFKTPEVGQRAMAAATKVPIGVLDTAGEGGAWGSAALASYLLRKERQATLEEYLRDQVFAGRSSTVVDPDPVDVAGFATFMKRYLSGFAIERAAGDALD